MLDSQQLTTESVRSAQSGTYLYLTIDDQSNLTARTFLSSVIVQGDYLPFANNSYEVVHCAYAISYAKDAFMWLKECARIIKVGGQLILEDILAPNDAQAKNYIISFYRLQRPSLCRLYADYEWEGLLLDAGLKTQAPTIHKTMLSLSEWNAPSDRRIYIDILLAQAPQTVAAWLQPQYTGTPFARFNHYTFTRLGEKI